MSCNTAVSLDAYYFLLQKALTVVFCITVSSPPQGYSESPDLEFEYADTDKWAAELSGKAQTFLLFRIFFSVLIFNKIKNECHFGVHFFLWLPSDIYTYISVV